MTDWLIHFVRDRTPGETPGHEEFRSWESSEIRASPSIAIETDASAFPVLLTVLNLGGLLAGRSYRNGKTTLFGPDPVVCFTEMPLHEFAREIISRGDSRRVAPYGIAVRKGELFAAGGRPAISGLSFVGERFAYSCYSDSQRILDPSLLPVQEQYRFVSYDPTRLPAPIDWTREREWRWKPGEGDEIFLELPFYSADFHPGLRLFAPREDGGHFSTIGIIVRTDAEAERVRQVLQMLHDAGFNAYDMAFDRKVIEASFVVVLDDLLAECAASGTTVRRIEEVPVTSMRSIAPAAPTDSELDACRRAVSLARDAADVALDQLMARHGDLNEVRDVCGWAWICAYSPFHPSIRALLQLGHARISAGDSYRIDVGARAPPTQALCVHEAVAEAAAAVLRRELDIAAWVRSEWD